jgi:molybdate transport system ATP-binding protein
LSATCGDLHVRLSHPVHPGLSIEVEFRLGNECGVLFGPSGTGKSTILRLIAGLIRPQAGTVRLGDEVLSDSGKKIHRPLRDRRIGLIFQDDLLFPHLSVDRNVRFGLGRWSKAEADARLLEIAALCGIDHLLGRDPSTLSGGERQRVGLARALAPRPRLLLCDEPVSALDLEARHALVDRIGRVRRVESIPILYVTHAPDEAIALGSRLFLLEAGRIVAEGSPLEVLSARGPRESFRLRNVFDAIVEGHEQDGLSTVLRVVDGPTLVVPKVDLPAGSSLSVEVGADDILLARGSIGLVSARNLISGTVERVVPHGHEAEVIVRTGGVSWAVGLISTAVEALGLIEGEEVRMIIKARSCRVYLDP